MSARDPAVTLAPGRERAVRAQDPAYERGRALPGINLKWPNWIGVVVEDLQAQRRFYRDVLGLKELEVGDDYVQFDMGFPNVLELIRRSAEPQYDQPRFQTGFAVEDIHAAREELIARGAQAVTDVAGGPEAQGYWCYFRDGEGNIFEISQRIGEHRASAPDA